MICPDCGHTNPDTNSWCSTCGSDLRSTIPPALVPESAVPPYAPTPAPQNSPRLALKRTAGPLFLTATILLIVSTVLTIIFTATGGLTQYILSSISSTYESMGMDDTAVFREIEQTMTPFLNSTSLVSALTSALPTMLIVLALFLIYGSARSANGDRPISTAGLTIIQVYTIIGLVSICIAAAIVLLVFIFALIAIANATGEAAAAGMIVMLVFMVLFAAMMVLFILYYVHLLRTIGAAKDVCAQGHTQRKPSMFVAVICFIGGGGNILSGLTSTIGAVLTPSMLLYSLAILASGVSTLLFGICLVKFRSALADAQQSALSPLYYGAYSDAPYLGGYLPPQQPQWQTQQPQWQQQQPQWQQTQWPQQQQPQQQTQWQQTQQPQWRSTMPNNAQQDQ